MEQACKAQRSSRAKKILLSVAVVLENVLIGATAESVVETFPPLVA